MHWVIVLRYVGSGDLIVVFLTFYIETTFFSWVTWYFRERHQLLSTWPQVYGLTGHFSFLLTFTTHPVMASGCGGLTLTWGRSGHGPHKLERRKKRTSAKNHEEDYPHPKKKRPFPSFQVLLPQPPPPNSSANFQGQSNAFCNSDPHKAVFQYFWTF